MEETTVRLILASNALQVLETAVMAFAETADDVDAVDAQLPILAARMDFYGPSSGCMILAAGEELGRRLAMDMLGLDDAEEEEADPADALRELLNIIGTISLESIFPGESLEVEPPRALSFPGYLELFDGHRAGHGTGARLVSRQGFVMEEGVLEIALFTGSGDWERRASA